MERKRLRKEIKNGMGHEYTLRSHTGLKGEEDIQKDTQNGNMVAIKTKQRHYLGLMKLNLIKKELNKLFDDCAL